MGKGVLALIIADKNTQLERKVKAYCDILTAATGGEVFYTLNENKNIDIILLDMDSISNGFEMLEKTAGHYGIPVVVCTDDKELQTRSLEAGAADFISPEDSSDTIARTINTVIRLCSDKTHTEGTALRELHYSALINNLPGGVAVIETDGKTAFCSYFNSELLSLFGMNDSEFMSQFCADNLPKWLKSFIIEARNSNKFSFIFSVGDEKSPDCQWIRLIASGLNEKDKKSELYCVFLDMNAEKRQEIRVKEADARLRENKSRLEYLISSAPGGMSYSQRTQDGHFKTLYVSKGLAEILGYSDFEEFSRRVRENPVEYISAEDTLAVREEIEKALKSDCRLRYDFSCTSRDGRKLWLSMNSIIRTDKDGQQNLHSFITDITKEKAYEQDLKMAAYYDRLTGLHNRAAFLKDTEKILSENPNREYTILVLNIGGFKAVNDMLGRETGDKILCVIACAIRTVVTGKGEYARLFADNFAILTPYSEQGIHPRALLNTVQQAVMDSGLVPNDIQIYIGVYRVSDRSNTAADMIDRAAIACRSVTGSLREHIAHYDETMRRRILEEQEICDESHRALRNGEFCVYFQAVYGVKAEQFVSAEALVRWNHPTKGMISPGRFIPVFEKNGFIAELDLYVMEQVCKYHKKRSELGLKPFPISVNLSRTSLYNPKLFDIICNLTDKYEVSPDIFRIEITESAYNDNPSQLLDTVKKFREKGYPVLMDDFGSGYSSLNTLKDIPIDILKLDMKFMQGFEKNQRVGTIVTSVARLARWMDIPMLAEGVETKEQLEFLASIGCSYIQGFYFAKPNPEEEFTALIAKGSVDANEIIATEELGNEINEIFGGNPLVTKLIDSVYGALGIYELYDGRLEVIRVNEGYNRMMGYDDNSFIKDKTNIWDNVYPEDLEISKNACLEAARTGAAVRAVVRRYNSKGKLMYLNGIHNRLGGTDSRPIICIAFNDVTREIESGSPYRSSALRETAKEAVRRSDALLQKTVRHLPVGVGIFRLEKGMPVPLYISDKMYKLFGITSSENNYNPRVMEEFVRNNILIPGTSGEYSFKYTPLSGESRWLRVIYRVLAEKNNTLIYSTVSDISDEIENRRRETAQQQLYQVLLAETGTIVFNYRPDVDELSYRNPFSDGQQYSVIYRLSENADSLELIDSADRQNFVRTLKRLSDEEDTAELVVRINTGNSPKRYRAFFKSLCDEEGVVFRIIGKFDDVDDEMSRVDEIREKAMYDSLCVNVFNKSTTEQLIKTELEKSSSGALMMIDVDDFKSINDSLGHMFGDEFLKKFAAAVKQVFRESDIIGRYGGDEFFVFLPHTNAALAEKKGWLILEKIKEIEIPKQGSVKCSIGVSEVSETNRNYRMLVEQADTALYQAKNSGKNCVAIFDGEEMTQGTFRTESAVRTGRNSVEISSNPSFMSSLIMRVFSALYGSTNITDGINQMLELVGKTFDVSLVYIFEDSDDGLYCSNTFEWCNEGVESKKAMLQNLSYQKDLGGNYGSLMNDDGILYCHDINDLDEGRRNINLWTNTKSILQCAILDNGVWKGFVGFNELRSNRFWTDEQVDSLVFISKIISIFLLKDRSANRSANLPE